MFTQTTTALLEALADPADDGVWGELDRRYRPILIGLGRHLGLDPEDAADAAQETLLRFAREYRAGKYDRSRGSLHAWMTGIARHCIVDVHKLRAGRRELRGDSALVDVPAASELTRLWEAECHQAVLQDGLRRLRHETRTDPRTIDAFERVVLHQGDAPDVAIALEMSLNDVYLAKYRCLKRLRAILKDLSEAYELDCPIPRQRESPQRFVG